MVIILNIKRNKIHDAFQAIFEIQSRRMKIEKNEYNSCSYKYNNYSMDKENKILNRPHEIKNIPKVNIQQDLMSHTNLEKDVELVKKIAE